MRGECHFELGELDKAVGDLTKAIELQPDNSVSYNKRGDTYLKQKQWEKALSDHVQTIMARKYARGSLNLFTYPDTGQWDEVLEKYTMAVNSEPNNYQHLKRRGIAYGLLGRWTQAEEDFTRAISLNPEAVELYQKRGYVYMRAGGKWAEMAADYSKAIELVPQSTWYWHERGFANGWLGKWEEMAADYTKVISLHPYGWGGWERRSVAYAKLGQYEKAIADYRKAVEVAMESTREFPKEPEYPSSRLASCANRLAWGLVTSPDVSRRDAATAVELAEKAVQAKAEESTYWNTLGAAYYRAGRFEDAIRALRKSIELGTSRHRGTDLFFIAMAEFQLGMKEEARESYNEAVEWRGRHKPGDEELERLGAEAAELLGIAEEAGEEELEIER